MQQSGQNRHTFRSPAVALFALLGLVVTSGVGCDGSDSTDFPTNGGSGGSAGRAGSAGMGGRAGTGGTAGTGGSAGTTGGTGGSSGTSGGTGGSAGTGGSSDGDAGVTDASVTDAAPVLSAYEQLATTLCATYDELVGCEPTSTCVQENVGALEFFRDNVADCLDEAEAFYACIAAQPVTSFECADGTTPQYIAATPPCAEEQAAFDAGNMDPSSCVD